MREESEFRHGGSEFILKINSISGETDVTGANGNPSGLEGNPSVCLDPGSWWVGAESITART